MSDLLLTGKEIDEIIGKETYYLAIYRAIAKAQHSKILRELKLIIDTFEPERLEVPVKHLIARMEIE